MKKGDTGESKKMREALEAIGLLGKRGPQSKLPLTLLTSVYKLHC